MSKIQIDTERYWDDNCCRVCKKESEPVILRVDFGCVTQEIRMCKECLQETSNVINEYLGGNK